VPQIARVHLEDDERARLTRPKSRPPLVFAGPLQKRTLHCSVASWLCVVLAGGTDGGRTVRGGCRIRVLDAEFHCDAS